MDPWSFRRISVRVLENSEARDVIGRVIWRTREEVRLMRRDGWLDTVRIGDIIAAREVPDDPGRLRPAEQFDREKLTEIIREHDPLSETHKIIAVKNLPVDPIALADAPDWPSVPGTDWWTVAPADWRDSAERWQAPEIRAFGHSDTACCRIVLAGDWCGLNIAPAPDSPPASPGRLVDDAFAWARARGAAYAWMLLREYDESRSTAGDLGFAVLD